MAFDKIDIDVDSLIEYLCSDKKRKKENDLFLVFIKKFAFLSSDSDSYKLITTPRKIQDIHKCALICSENFDEYVKQLKIFGNSHITIKEDQEIFQSFLEYVKLSDNIKNF